MYTALKIAEVGGRNIWYEELGILGSMFSIVFVKLCREFVVVFGSVVTFT